MGEKGAPGLPVTTAVLDLWRHSRQEFTLRLEGRSMVPVASPGDRVTIQPISTERLCCGDIIALHQGEKVVVHRLLMSRTAADGSRSCCQKGDNSRAWSWVPPETVLGRVTAIRSPEHTLLLLRRPWTWINPLAGRLGRLGMFTHRLSRLLLVPLIRLGLWLSPS